MTKKFFLMLFSSILVTMAGLGLSACGGDDEPSSNSSNDPEGTVTANIMFNSGADISGVDLYLDKNYNFKSDLYAGNSPAWIFVSLGKVKSLSSINNIPSSGWSEQVAAEVGYGYIIGLRTHVGWGSYGDPIINYARMYVEKTITGASGEILGYTVKVQYPWNP